MVGKTLRGGLATAAVALMLVLPAQAHADAGSLDLTSSMSATCMGPQGGNDCSTLVFELKLHDGDFWVDFVRLQSAIAGPWRFAANNPVSVQDGNGNALNGWNATWDSNEILLASAGQRGIDPIYLVVNMTSWGSSSDFRSLTYNGSGCVSADCQATMLNPASGQFTNTVSFDGTVTPEPISMVLLGSGLMGVAAARRRRNLLTEDEEV